MPSTPPPPDDELVIGLVAALGIDLTSVAEDLQLALSEFGYRSHLLHLTNAFADFDWPMPLVEEPFDTRVWSYMDAGDKLCELWKRMDAMAMLAITQVGATRADLTGDFERPPPRTAYILRSLKRPQEVALLRNVYGRRFFLIGASTEESARLQYLDDRIRHSRIPPHNRTPEYSAADLAARDESDDRRDHGQNVRETFHLADIFVDTSRNLLGELVRALDTVHGNPKRTPSRQEVGMMHAATAALRSAELGRQVGAAICTKDGAVIATGTNEVPRAFGGQYWEGDTGDARDITKGHDTNTVTRRGIAEEIEKALIDDELLKVGVEPQKVLKVVEESHFGDVIEYVRAVHAEMAAIADAAKRGVSVEGCVLYATTFPCHHCARHIVAAGIAEVVFIAPYAKSLALQLHEDALTVGQKGDGTKVPFVPFIGIGPLRFDPLFEHAKRRDDDGELRQYDPMTAETRIEDRDPPELRSDRLPYLPRERRVDGMLAEAETDSGFKMKRETEE